MHTNSHREEGFDLALQFRHVLRCNWVVAHSHWPGIRRLRDIHIKLAHQWHLWHHSCFKHCTLETTKKCENIFHLMCQQVSELSSDLGRDKVKSTLRFSRQPWNICVKKIQYLHILGQFFIHVTESVDGRESVVFFSCR